tara:strand:+ start:469 stop:765 length:297 start_codon:yes stop_codon:yes gene_type:complete
MTKDDIIKLAREVGLTHDKHWNKARMTTAFMLDFANLVAAHKAEIITAEAYRCGYKDGIKAAAVICENVAGMYQHAHNASSENIADECAAAIRMRNQS